MNLKLSFKPAYFEVAFGPRVGIRRSSDKELSTIEPVQLGGVKIQGKIDRIDVSGEEFIIYDYKTGKVNVEEEEIEKGIHLQIPLYIRIAEEIFKERGVEMKGVGGYNYVVRRNVGRKAVIAQEKAKSGKERSNYFNQNEFNDKINNSVGKVREFVDKIAKGKFNLTEHDDMLGSICGNCAYIEICRINEVKFGVQIKKWG